MPMNKSEIGKRGEDFACERLTEKGYLITERNFHLRCGEIDIIAENDSTIAFVEVKTRSSKSASMPREAVDNRKQRKIILTALMYLQTHPKEKTPRFDVFEVWHDGKGIYKFSHIKNAFDLSAFGGEYELF